MMGFTSNDWKFFAAMAGVMICMVVLILSNWGLHQKVKELEAQLQEKTTQQAR